MYSDFRVLGYADNFFVKLYLQDTEFVEMQAPHVHGKKEGLGAKRSRLVMF